MGNNFAGKIAGVGAGFFCGGHGAIGLVIAKTGFFSRRDHRLTLLRNARC